MAVYVSGIGLCAPGLPDWPTAQAVLADRQPYQDEQGLCFNRVQLPRNEQRRATLTVRLALQIAAEALAVSGIAATDCGAVFTCAGGNTEALDALCQALLQPERLISPSQFNHSVHNAPLGYWSIATGSMQAAVSVGAYDASFAAGLLEASALAQSEQRPVLLVAYDTPPPLALQGFRPVSTPFGVSLLLTPSQCPATMATVANLSVQTGEATAMKADALEQLRLTNPAARSLPLLQRLAVRQAGVLSLPYLPPLGLRVSVEPC